MQTDCSNWIIFNIYILPFQPNNNALFLCNVIILYISSATENEHYTPRWFKLQAFVNCKRPSVLLKALFSWIAIKLLFVNSKENCPSLESGQNEAVFHCNDAHIFTNIAKGTTDPRVEFLSQVLTHILIKYNLQNLHQASNSKSQPNISISTKLKLQNLDQT